MLNDYGDLYTPKTLEEAIEIIRDLEWDVKQLSEDNQRLLFETYEQDARISVLEEMFREMQDSGEA